MSPLSERLRRIEEVEAKPGHRLRLRWAGGPEVEIDFSPFLQRRAFNALTKERDFAGARVGDWGHSVEWPSGIEIGADSLWLETLSATGRKDARTFLDWRHRHGLSLSDAANALGVSRRMVAYYSSGEKPVPKHVLLACLGWEVASNADQSGSTIEDEVRSLMPA
jgi:hypothetical protein